MPIIFWIKDDRNKSLRIYHNDTSTLIVLKKKLILDSNKFSGAFIHARRLWYPYNINIKRYILDSKIFTQNLHRNELVFYFYFIT